MKVISRKLKLLRWGIYLFAATVLLGFLHAKGNDFLTLYDLQFRPWLNTLLLGLFFLTKCSTIILIVYVLIRKLFHCIEKVKVKTLADTLTALVLLLLIIALGFMISWEMFALSLSYKKEEIVYYNDTKCVSCEDSWLDTWVDYYEYKGPFFMGERSLYHELY